MTFGLDVCMSAATGLIVISLLRRPGDRRAMLLAALLALALGIRCNVNWASAALLPLGIYGLWRVRPMGKIKAGLVFTAVLAAWAIPAVVWGGSRPGYVQATMNHFAEVSWWPSALGFGDPR